MRETSNESLTKNSGEMEMRDMLDNGTKLS